MPIIVRILVLVSCVLAATGSAFADQCYVVGTWNLEHFGFNKPRGFPEVSGQIGPRTPEQLDGIAEAIRDEIKAKVLVLNEINGRNNQATSAELDDLTQRLGSSWRYIIARSGASQRNAIIWDSDFVEKIAHFEIRIAAQEVQGEDIFKRDPLAGYFRFVENGDSRNDIVVVALHLASGTHLTKNHDRAMTRLRNRLRTLRGHNPVLPQQEDDIVLAGDLNASPYDDLSETFFDAYNQGNWNVLAGTGTYPETRVSGKSLDYIIVTQQNDVQQGLWGEEITSEPADVWGELGGIDEWDAFRENYSDHSPVTTCVAVTDDTD